MKPVAVRNGAQEERHHDENERRHYFRDFLLH